METMSLVADAYVTDRTGNLLNFRRGKLLDDGLDVDLTGDYHTVVQLITRKITYASSLHEDLRVLRILKHPTKIRKAA